MNLYDILSMKFPNNTIRFDGDIRLADHGLGEGAFIAEWFVPGVEKPTKEQLDQWAIELLPQFTADQLAIQKAIANAPIQEKLDRIDLLSIRAIRTGDTVRMASLEAQAAALRLQLVK